MKDNLYVEKEAREKLIAGVDKVANAVKGTLGAAGYNGLIEAFEYPFSITTNDGISIAKSIVLADPVENIGANLIKEVATRSDKSGGDGTTTAITLAQAILHEGIKAEVAPMVLKRSLEDCLPIIEESIKQQTKEITVDEVGRVAAISAEDEKIGELIQKIYQTIGKDGILYPDVSKTADDHYVFSSGVKIEDAGLASPYMADVDEKTMQPLNAATFRDVRVLVTKQKITQARGDLENIIGALRSKENGKELVIFCDEWEPTVIPDLVTTRFKNGFRVALIKLPVVWKDQWFEDLCKLTGATLIDGAGITLSRMKVDHLGKVGSFLSDKTNTFLEGTLDISEYMKTLSEGSDEEKIRAARLNTKTARLFVGAPTDAALSYKRLKVEDARNAAYQALHGGVVAGGGVALVNASVEMPDTIGGNILRQALTQPAAQILANCGLKGTIVGSSSGPMTMGLDARTGKSVDMFEAGIVDPANVVMTAVRNAVSVAATVLTARVVTVIPEEMKKMAPAQPGL